MGVLRVGVIEPSALNKVRLTWSEPVNAAAANTAGNYTFTGGLACTAAALVAGTGNTVSELTITGLTNGQTYQVTVANVQDSATSTAIISPNEKGSFIWREVGDNNLNGVVETGGNLERLDRMLTGDQLLGYNVLGGTPPDTVLPVITIISPAPNSNLGRNDVVTFTVTDNLTAFRRIVVTALYPDGSHEVVHNGDAFLPNYQHGSSTRTVIANGFQYTMCRVGGWTIGRNPTLVAYAIDTAGNEAA